MKNYFFAMTAMTLVVAGCDVKESATPSTTAPTAAAKKFVRPGGQPGKITVQGVIVRKDGDKTELDERIWITQSAGKAIYGEDTEVSEKSKPLLDENFATEEVEGLKNHKTFINLGCKDLSADETADLEDITATNALADDSALVAAKVFVCGDQVVKTGITIIEANEIVMNNASITKKGGGGQLSVVANKLSLKGMNSLATLGYVAVDVVPAAAEISVIVSTEVGGDGTLLLKSVGGDSVGPEQHE